jgi:hypothetical protein
MSERTVAILKGNIVSNVIVVTAEHQLEDGEVEYTDANPAGIGWEYDGTGFISPRPFPSWQLVNYRWEPPVPMPDDGEPYYWDEDSTSWKLIEP